MVEKNIEELQAPPSKAKGRADIVFLIDVTSSMSPCIEKLKSSIGTFFDELRQLELEGVTTPSWRIRFITFKDLDRPEDTEPRLDDSRPFVEDPQEVINQLNSITIEKYEKYQGGDEPESIWEAIYVAAAKSDWRPAIGKERVHRVIVAFTDAPPKDRFNTSVLLEEDKDALDPNTPIDDIINFLTNLLATNKIKLFLYAPDNQYYTKLCNGTPGSLYVNVGRPGDKARYEGLKNVDYKDVLKRLAKTISE